MRIKINNEDIPDYMKIQNTKTSRSNLSLPTDPFSTENTPESSPRGLMVNEPASIRDLIDQTQTGWEQTGYHDPNRQDPNYLGLGATRSDVSLKAVTCQGTRGFEKTMHHSNCVDIPDAPKKSPKSVTNQGGNLLRHEAVGEKKSGDKSRGKSPSRKSFMKT